MKSIKSEKVFANEVEKFLRFVFPGEIRREATSGDGYCGMVVTTEKICYVIGFTYSSTATKAIDQVIAKRYAQDIDFKGQVYGVGINYDPEKNAIDQPWRSGKVHIFSLILRLVALCGGVSGLRRAFRFLRPSTQSLPR